MSLYSRLKIRARRFASDTGGSMPVEGVIASTFLIWWYIGSFQFFDAYRQKNVSEKAAYTIADMVSRRTESIDADYVDGLHTLFDYMTVSRRPTWLRVSSVFWDADESRYEVAWSHATGDAVGHSDLSIQARAAEIPMMPDGDAVVVVETSMAYVPIFNIGLDAQRYQTFVTARPRFAACVPFDREDGTPVGCIYDGHIAPVDESADDGLPELGS